MSVIYLDEQGASLHKAGGLLVVKKGTETLAEIRIKDVERIVIVGNFDLTTPSLAVILDRCIPTVFMSTRGKCRGTLQPPFSKNVPLRLAQHAALRDKEKRLRISAGFVAGKLANARAFLLRYSRNHPEINLEDAASTIERARNEVSSARDLPQLVGIEGAGSRAYFDGLSHCFPWDFPFKGRSRRPPADRANSLLGFGYTLLAGEIFSALTLRGFDPYLGLYHEVAHGRPSLALDLMEEFRHPVVDAFVLSIVNTRAVCNSDFHRDSVYLSEEGRKKYFVTYEQLMNRQVFHRAKGARMKLRRLFFVQADELASSLLAAAAYHPFTID